MNQNKAVIKHPGLSNRDPMLRCEYCSKRNLYKCHCNATKYYLNRWWYAFIWFRGQLPEGNFTRYAQNVSQQDMINRHKLKIPSTCASNTDVEMIPILQLTFSSFPSHDKSSTTTEQGVGRIGTHFGNYVWAYFKMLWNLTSWFWFENSFRVIILLKSAWHAHNCGQIQ